MSRIHEALKKAAQEKNANLASGNGNDVALSSEELAGAAVPAVEKMRLDEIANRGDGTPTEFFRFEEFVKRCAHPQWRIDPAASVFSAINVDTVGAEVSHAAFAPLSNCGDSDSSKAFGHQHFAAGRQDLHGSESSVVVRKTAGTSSAADRR